MAWATKILLVNLLKYQKLKAWIAELCFDIVKVLLESRNFWFTSVLTGVRDDGIRGQGASLSDSYQI